MAKCVADLAIHSAQLASIYDVTLGDAWIERLDMNAKRFSPSSDFAHRLSEVRKPSTH